MHATGTSSVARNVLADVTAEYLQNVGRTIRFLSDKFGKVMTPEVRASGRLLFRYLPCWAQEIILHTLFESGSSKVQDLERYISDDIERYGSRLGELEKKMVSAYRETVSITNFQGNIHELTTFADCGRSIGGRRAVRGRRRRGNGCLGYVRVLSSYTMHLTHRPFLGATLRIY